MIQTDKDQNPSCQSQTTNANTYKTSSLQQPAILSPYHFATSANTGHWTEQLPVGNGYLGAFTGGTVRHTIVPISVTNLFGYTNGHLAAEKQERTGQDIPPPGIYKELRTEFLQEDGTTWQRIQARVPVELPVHDYAGTAEAFLGQFVRPFAMSEAPLWRVAVVRHSGG
ncbi:hypothetical protein EON64_16920, partial [archaeon]